jgi:hypothetical protein
MVLGPITLDAGLAAEMVRLEFSPLSSLLGCVVYAPPATQHVPMAPYGVLLEGNLALVLPPPAHSFNSHRSFPRRVLCPFPTPSLQARSLPLAKLPVATQS